MRHRPSNCLRCGAPEVVPVAYGLPDEMLCDMAARGEAVLGGCIYTGTERWACLICEYRWPLPGTSLDGDMLQEALVLAHEAHSGEADHPIEVAHLLWEEGYGETVVAAGLLHDALDFACWDPKRIRSAAGDAVADLVDALTQDRDIGDYEKRRLELRARVGAAGHRAVAIYAADRLSELRGLRADYDDEGEAVTARLEASLETLLSNFERDLRMLERPSIRPPFIREIRAELEDLRADCAAARQAQRRRATLRGH